ncbi:MAG: ABC transporter ATP-binding protein [Bacillota bacterium]|nr:ABC transporter ATP-binding protein [Bacillota bacterium]
MENILEVKGLKKQFGGLTAVNNIDFTVEVGSRTGIIGPNGAGKTTTFSMIAGEHQPTAGTIMFDGERIDKLKPSAICKKGIARTFQVVRVFRELTVYEHVVMGAVAGKACFSTCSYRKDEIEYLLELTGFENDQDKISGSLTSARQKQLGLATALATKPKLLLLDELMAGLNLTEIERSLLVLRKVNEEMDITLVIIEHVMRVIMGLCKKVIVLDTGQIIAEGTPQEISENETVINAYLGKEEKAHAGS